jgi:Tol biopolymer transport system component
MRGHRRIGVIGSSLLLVVSTTVAGLAATTASSSRPGATQRVSVSSSGAQGNAASGDVVVGQNMSISMTPDARYVAFTSTASNLVAGDTNGHSDVFVRDRATGRTERVSVDSDGGQGVFTALPTCPGAWSPSISADGRYVAFISCYPLLVSKPVYLGDQVFVHDRHTGNTVLASVDKDGRAALPGGEYSANISGDGHRVVFTSSASNLVGTCAVPLGLLCGSVQVVVRDLARRTTEVVSVAADGTPANDLAEYPSISANGRYVVFGSFADNLSPAAQNGPCLSYPLNSFGHRACGKVFRRDLTTKRTEVVSLGLHGETPDNGAAIDSPYAAPSISADGRYVLYTAEAKNLVPSPPLSGLYVRDMQTGRTQNVRVDSSGRVIAGGGFGSISPDGRYIAYVDAATGTCPIGQATCVIPCTGENAPTGTPQNALEYVVYDRVTGSREEFCDPAKDPAGGFGSMTLISAGGRYVAFASGAPDLVSGDTNKAADVFVRDRGRDLGAGGLAANGRLAVAGMPAFRSTGVVRPAIDNSALVGVAGRVVDATVSYREHSADLFVRLGVSRLATGVGYGLRLDTGAAAYEVRAAGAGVLGASFGLWRLSGSRWVRVADLAGGYGTTGEEVVVAVPLAALGLDDGGRLSGLRAFAFM